MTDRHPFSTRRGRRVRQHQLRHQPLCQMCLSLGVVTAASTVDHVVMLQDGGDPFDPANLRSLCLPCHKQRHGTRPKPDIDPATGLPIAGGHWWSTER
jgi:5-methylcytosine-specific restriction enzyme A